MKINIWKCVKDNTPVRTAPIIEFNVKNLLKSGYTTMELDRITDCNGKVLWIRHIDGWTDAGYMKLCDSDCVVLDIPFFHFSISNIESYIKNIENEIRNGYSLKEFESIIYAIIRRELILLNHLNNLDIDFNSKSLDQLEEYFNDCQIAVVGRYEYAEMKKAYAQIKAIKQILEASK